MVRVVMQSSLMQVLLNPKGVLVIKALQCFYAKLWLALVLKAILASSYKEVRKAYVKILHPG